MKYNIYKVIQNNQKEHDIAVVSIESAYEYNFHADIDSKDHYISTVDCSSFDIYNLNEVKEMNYYAELAKGIVIFFKQEANLYKWLYNHCNNQSPVAYNFKVFSYGKLKA